MCSGEAMGGGKAEKAFGVLGALLGGCLVLALALGLARLGCFAMVWLFSDGGEIIGAVDVCITYR